MEFIVEKIGMSRTIGLDSTAVTLLRIVDTKVCCFLDDGRALVAYKKGKFTNKPILGNQNKYNVSKEYNNFAILKVNNSDVGNIDLSVLSEAKKVNVSLRTKGRGFSGVVKRWNFAGGPAAHGSRFHRAPGSIGNREWPGRVQKGKKMSGHYGNDTVSTKNTVLSFDKDNSLLIIKGSIAGHNGMYGRLRIAS